MSGQGCPNFVFAFCTSKKFVVFGFALALISLQSLANGQDLYPLNTASATQGSTLTQRVRLRFSWGGGTNQTWAGAISVTNGAFSNVAPLGLSAEASAEVMQVGEELIIQHWSPSNYGGGDVTLEGNPDTQIHFVLSSVESPESRFKRTFSFDELLSGNVGGEIDATGNRCSVSRAPGDMVGIVFERDHLVFKPGEPFSLAVRPNLTGLSTRSANCRVKLVPAHVSGLTVNRSLLSKTLTFPLDENGSSDSQEVTLNVPVEEGIYNIELEFEPNWYQASLSAKRASIRRSIQLMVLSDQRKARQENRAWKHIATVDPVNVEEGSFPSLSQLARIVGISDKDTLGNELRTDVVVNERPMMQLSPGGWQAIPISVDRLDKPHLVEFEYVADGEMALGVSLLQPDASGQIPLYGFDSGVFIPKSLVGTDAKARKIRRHRLTIWPKTKTPYLLVANRHASSLATVGKISVFAGPDRLDPSETAANPNRPTRKLMAFYEAPLFPENFGAREKVDPAIGEPLDDWRMFYQGAERFIEYLQANAYRGAFITVACDGSSIYPSQHLSPSPKHDNGTFFSTGQDPIRKDILEMLFRMFEREGLVLVPTLAMSGPIPEIELTRNRDGTDSEFELVDLNQTKRISVAGRSSTNAMLPIYNPLNRQVQRSVVRVVEELAERYKFYSSFDGIAIICRPDTYTLLPGRQWGYDPSTIQQFLQSQPSLESVSNDWSEIRNVLLGSHRNQWIQWRAAQMTQWYKDMAIAISRALPNGRLYLAPVDLYRNEETASSLSPSLHASTDFDQSMLHMGFALNVESGSSLNDNGIVLLNPHRVAPDQSLSSKRVDMAVENSKQAQQFFSNVSYAGDLFTHRISWAHFAQLQSKSPFGNQQSPLMRLQQMAPAEQFNRQRFVQSIKDRDARLLVDGGWLVTMGQEESVLDMMQVFGRLPDVPFKDVNSSKSPHSQALAVRQLQFEDETFFYIANASPWPMQVKLFIDSKSNDSPLDLQSLSGQPFQIKPASAMAPNVGSAEAPATGQIEIVAEVPAYGLIGGRSPSVFQVTDFGFELPENADKNLRRHVYSLQSKLIKSGNPQPLPVLENSGFEFAGQPTLDGWDSGQQSTGKVRLDTAQYAADADPEMGRVSLLMSNEDPAPVWVRSNSFEATETGRLSISVWLKTNDASKQPPIRLAVEGQSKGSSYYRFGSVGSLSPDPTANQVEARWKRFAVHFDDLPADGLSNVRIGFDLMGPGQVNIDNVEVFDRWFDENDAKAITQMLASTGPLLSSQETFDRCRRLLEGYWPSFLDQFIGDDKAAPESDENGSDPTERLGDARQLNQNGTGENPMSQAKNTGASKGDTDEDGTRKAPMFRRFRSLVPQRKSTLR